MKLTHFSVSTKDPAGFYDQPYEDESMCDCCGATWQQKLSNCQYTHYIQGVVPPTKFPHRGIVFGTSNENPQTTVCKVIEEFVEFDLGDDDVLYMRGITHV